MLVQSFRLHLGTSQESFHFLFYVRSKLINALNTYCCYTFVSFIGKSLSNPQTSMTYIFAHVNIIPNETRNCIYLVAMVSEKKNT
jgi:hypothetical protein